jgi:hypothetical protein
MDNGRRDQGEGAGSRGEGKGAPPDEGPRGDTSIERDLEELERAEGSGRGAAAPPPSGDELRPDTPDEDEAR